VQPNFKTRDPSTPADLTGEESIIVAEADDNDNENDNDNDLHCALRIVHCLGNTGMAKQAPLVLDCSCHLQQAIHRTVLRICMLLLPPAPSLCFLCLHHSTPRDSLPSEVLLHRDNAVGRRHHL
jgi:hypothetical protein